MFTTSIILSGVCVALCRYYQRPEGSLRNKTEIHIIGKVWKTEEVK